MRFKDKIKQPLISVIVPIYSVERYLEKCLCSITQQTYRNLEIVLVEDGSPDSCGAICDHWSRLDQRIIVIHKENGGLSDARNTGIREARGDYLCFVDADDYIEPQMIERLYGAVSQKDVLISICNFTYEFEDNEEPCDYMPPETYQIHTERVLSAKELMEYINAGKHVFGTVAWNKLYKKDIFQSIQYPVGKIHEDEYVFHQIIDRCDKFACISYVGYHYLKRENSIMSNGGNIMDLIDARMQRCQFFIEKGDRDLARLSEPQLYGAMRMAKEANMLMRRSWLLKQYIGLVWSLHKKCRIPMTLVCKRMIRFYLL